MESASHVRRRHVGHEIRRHCPSVQGPKVSPTSELRSILILSLTDHFSRPYARQPEVETPSHYYGMTRFRTVLFWMHLTAGSLAGIVVLVMCVTGVALTYEKQVLEWADTRSWSAPLSAGASHLPPETLLAKVRQAQPGAAPTGLSMRADAQAPATLTLDGNESLLVDPYSGIVIGTPPQGMRVFFRSATSWHRYLALEGDSRPTGRMLTGASNLIFFFIVLSGMYLWIPKTLSWLQVSRVMWFRRGLPTKARHFNWHNTIGIWCAVPLAIVVAGAIPISYAWGNALVYRLVGEEAPAPGGGARPAGGRDGEGRPGPEGRERREGGAPSEARPRREAGQQAIRVDGLDAAWMKATSEVRVLANRERSLRAESTVALGLHGRFRLRRATAEASDADDRSNERRAAQERKLRQPDTRTARAIVAAIRPHRRVLWVDRSDDRRCRIWRRRRARLHRTVIGIAAILLMDPPRQGLLSRSASGCLRSHRVQQVG